MKKTGVIVAAWALVVCFFFACAEDDSCDTKAIVARIESLEAAINANSWELFMENVHSATNQFDTFDQTSLDTITTNGLIDYDFHGYDVSCDGDSRASVSCTASVGANDYDTSFIMRTEGGGWYVYRWTEETDTMYDRYSPPSR
jgi:hypothetical protein